MAFREEADTMGTVLVPKDAYYGASTQRAVENFSISGLTLQTGLIHALALVKKSAAGVNAELGHVDREAAAAIEKACEEVMAGRFDDQFVVDVFQTGSGTSTNMNLNEVLATRANEILTGRKQGKRPVHPNDHVNAGQSSNDVIPTAIHVAARMAIGRKLIPALEKLKERLERKSDEFADIQKIGRTHLQDAVPMSLGQEFSGYARQIELGIERMQAACHELEELALGGTAVGTGVNADPAFAERTIAEMASATGVPFREAKNHFEAQAAKDGVVTASGGLRTIAVSLSKIANDLRWLASGPRCGLGEITLPSLQPGSSIMPGKINPVIPEAVIQVAAQVIGNDAAIMLGGLGGSFELNTMMPLIAYNLLQSIELLANVVETFSEKCVRGTTANRGNCAGNIQKSLALATYLVPHIGYDQAAAVAKSAYESGKTVKEVLLAEKQIPVEVMKTIPYLSLE